MATAISPPQNPLRRRFKHETLAPHPRSAPNPSFNPDRHACSASTASRRKRSPPKSRSGGGVGVGGGGSRSRFKAVDSPAANNKLVMGQVKILKRGETFSEFPKERSCDNESTSSSARRPMMRHSGGCLKDFDIVLGSTDRIGPEPDTVTKQIRACKRFEGSAGGFAGASCSLSPPPSAVPIPGFLDKKIKRDRLDGFTLME